MTSAYKVAIPEKAIDFVEAGRRPRRDHEVFDLARDLEFSTDALRSYAYAAWSPVLYDAMVLAAAIEFADMSVKRPSRGWARRLALRIPVHDPVKWNTPAIINALHESLGFLTGDFWSIDFVRRTKNVPPPVQDSLPFPRLTKAVIAFSDGMDSLAVAGLEGERLGESLVRVRVGSRLAGETKSAKEPFARIPYRFRRRINGREASGRSRGFKFSLISGLAAFLSNADEIVIPESGQGAIGPALVTVTHAYPDYRNHPLFAKRMTEFLGALLGKPIRFVFPRIWYTKGQTLQEFVSLQGRELWRGTRSCWRSSRWSALDGQLRQCGVCAACMLRRMSVHAAGLIDDPRNYICSDLTAPSLVKGLQSNFTRLSPAFEQYAIAGVLHLDHMADMARAEAMPTVKRHGTLTAIALGIPARDAEEGIVRMLESHAREWGAFIRDLGPDSFIKKWTRAVQ